MSLFQEFRDSLSSVLSFPADYFAGWFGVAPSESGVEVNELTAMQVAAYVGCVRVLGDGVSSIPLQVMERLSDGSEKVSYDHPLADVLALAPNDEVSSADFRQTGQVHLLLVGNAYIEIAYNGAGQPGALYLRNPFRTFPYRNAGGELFYKTNDNDNGTERWIDKTDMIHVKGLGMDSLMGLSPVKYYAREVLGTDLAAQSYGAKFFANDARPGGYLKAPGMLSKEKRLDYAQSWMAGHSRGQSHRMAVLDGGMEWQKIGVPPEEAQFLGTREFNRTQIASIFGVPPHFLGEAAESRANMEQRALEFLVFVLKPWLNKWEQAINIKLFPRVGRNSGRFYAKFDTTNFERATYADLLKGVQMGRYAGLYTTNEGRRLLGEQPFTKEQLTSKDPGDKIWRPVNMVWVGPEDLDPPVPDSEDDGSGGQGGNDQDGGDGGSKPASGTTQGGKRALRANDDAEIMRYFTIFYATFRDAMGRILARSKVNESDFQRAFSPVLLQIASAFNFRIDSEPGDMTLGAPNVQFIREYIAALAHRGASWTGAKADDDARTELLRAITVMRDKIQPAEASEAEPREEADKAAP